MTWDLLKWQEARHFDLRVSIFVSCFISLTLERAFSDLRTSNKQESLSEVLAETSCSSVRFRG